jgi:hypothetical protein
VVVVALKAVPLSVVPELPDKALQVDQQSDRDHGQ